MLFIHIILFTFIYNSNYVNDFHEGKEFGQRERDSERVKETKYGAHLNKNKKKTFELYFIIYVFIYLFIFHVIEINLIYIFSCFFLFILLQLNKSLFASFLLL